VSQSKRTPEVIVKVISPGSNCLEAIRHHFVDLQKGHGRSLETDFFNTPVVGCEAVRELIDDWNLDLDELTCRVTHLWRERRKPTKLVHKVIFSMPAGTPPDRLLAAVRDFAEQEYAPRYRYALALHTDEPHPHVHVVVRAETEYGKRLNIRKAMLREWRKAFVRHLRNHGVVSKATQRSIRGKARMSKLKGIYRPVRTPHAFPQKVAHRLCESSAAEL
jgi:type IV secretory pathway VirD2 relaxase